MDWIIIIIIIVVIVIIVIIIILIIILVIIIISIIIVIQVQGCILLQRVMLPCRLDKPSLSMLQSKILILEYGCLSVSVSRKDPNG